MAGLVTSREIMVYQRWESKMEKVRVARQGGD